MTTPDMDVIKDIPGYKVILKAVLKSQIQQLVEQLASSTDEESVILTASVSDGTLSHLGSDSGKNFLDDHEDIKSQFLGFCLKRHHKKKQQEKERQEAERQMATTPPKYMPRPGFMGPRQRFTSPRHQGPHPVALTRASPGSGIRGPGMRHSPYPMTRPPRRPPLNFDQQGRGPGPGPNIRPPLGNSNQVIKIEPDDEDSNQSANDTNVQTSVASSSQPSSPSQTAAASSTPSQIKAEASEKTDDDAKSESSSSTIPNEGFSDAAPPEGLSLDSDFSNLISGDTSKTTDTSSVQPSTSQSTSETTSELDPNVSVKVESMTEAEMELEITGVELGSNNPMAPMGGSQTWPVMGGASGSQADMAGSEQGYNEQFHYPELAQSSQFTDQQIIMDSRSRGDDSQQFNLEQLNLPSALESTSHKNEDGLFPCNYCGKTFSKSFVRNRHERSHLGDKPFKCEFCDFRCSRKDNLKGHIISRHFRPPL